MNLLIVGINHTSAPVSLREKVAFTPEQLADALTDVRRLAGFSEAAILSTCNRTEIIATATADAGDMIAWLARYHQMPAEHLQSSIYVKTGREAALHAARVASGLDSMVVGEPQILGQFKDCFEQARRAGTLGAELDHLAQISFRIAKKVRTETAIGETSVSMAGAAVTLAGRLFSDLPACRILLVGAGDTSAQVGRHLKRAGITNITIANRTLARARRLAAGLGAAAIDLQAIQGRLAETDIVIASTAAQLPILGKGSVERALKARKHRPILMVDLAVPRDIEPEVGDLRDIYLYSVDDLQEIIDMNLNSRRAAAWQAEAIVRAELDGYRSKRELRAADGTLVRFRARHDRIRQEELDKALARLAKGEDAAQVLDRLAHRLTNKIMHTPSMQLKAAAAEGLDDFLAAIEQLYRLDRDIE